jgi:hypothetical protein
MQGSYDPGMADETYVELSADDSGAPILLATRAPGQVAAQPDPSGVVILRGAASGNPKADPATGRFAGGASGRTVKQQGADVTIVQQTRTLPQGMDEATFERRHDIIREAAREMDKMGAGDAKDFLKGRVADLSTVNIDLFLQDVHAQRLDDLVDIFDAQLRNKVASMTRARRFVRVTAPKGWTTRVFAGLDDTQMIKLVTRLEGKGWDPKDLVKNVIGKVSNEERRTKLEQLYSEPKKKSGKKSARA